MPKWLLKHEGSPYLQYEFRIDGRVFRGTTRTKNVAQAKGIVERLRSQAVLGIFKPRAPSLTIDEAFGRYQVEVADSLREGKEIMRRLGTLMRHLGKDRRLSEITTSDLIAFRVARLKEPDGRRKPTGKGETPITISARTVNMEVMTYRRLWRHAWDAWDLDLGRELRWKRILLPVSAGRTRHLARVEEAGLVPQLPDDLAALIRFAIRAGARLSSCIRLEWRDVDEASGRITFRGVKSRRKGEMHSIPNEGELPAILATRKGQHGTFVFTWARQRRSKTAAKGERHPFTKDGWRKTWRRALAAAGIADFRFHDLRHTAGTRILAATGNLLLARDLLGHADLTSAQRYAHVLDGALAEGMRRVDPRNIPGIETGEAGTPPVSSTNTSAYKENDNAGS